MTWVVCCTRFKPVQKSAAPYHEAAHTQTHVSVRDNLVQSKEHILEPKEAHSKLVETTPGGGPPQIIEICMHF